MSSCGGRPFSGERCAGSDDGSSAIGRSRNDLSIGSVGREDRVNAPLEIEPQRELGGPRTGAFGWLQSADHAKGTGVSPHVGRAEIGMIQQVREGGIQSKTQTFSHRK